MKMAQSWDSAIGKYQKNHFFGTRSATKTTVMQYAKKPRIPEM
jgi:hypothetical protein